MVQDEVVPVPVQKQALEQPEPLSVGVCKVVVVVRVAGLQG